MSTRHHRRLLWPFAVALLGTAACAGSPTTSPPIGSTQPGGGTAQPGGGPAQPGGGTTQPGGGTAQPGTTQPGTAQPGTTQPGTAQPGTTQPGTAQPGTTQPGTTQPGTTQPGGRRARIPGQERRPGGGTEGPAAGTQIDGICADVRSGADRVEESAQEASECDGSERDANADEQIAGMLRAIHGAEVQESANVDGSAQSESVRAFAQLMIISHRRALAENQALFERLSIQPDEHALTRGLEAGHLRGLSAIDTRGAELDREYMRRQILEHRRSIELVDLMLPRAQNPEMRCALESTRHEAMTHLEMACWIWDSLQSERGTAGGERGARKSQRGRVVPFEGGRAGQQASVIEPSVDEDCDETSTGERTGGEEARKQPRRGIAEDP